MESWSALERRWGPALAHQLSFLAERSIGAQMHTMMTRDRNVVGFGFGPKQTAGRMTDQAAVVVFVTRREPISALGPGRLIPPTIEGFATDVVPVGALRLMTDTQPRPVPWGCGVQPFIDPSSPTPLASTPGTLGGVVYNAPKFQASPPRAFVLSAAHVLAPEPEPGSTTTGAPFVGAEVVQGVATLQSGVIAKLARWKRLLPFAGFNNPTCWNRIDAAVASIDAPNTVVQENGPPGCVVDTWRAYGDVHAGLPVQYDGYGQWGSETANPRRTGKIRAIAARFLIPVASQTVYFVDQYVMEGGPAPGDSGALAIAPSRGSNAPRASAVGVVFAGSTSDENLSPSHTPDENVVPITVICPIDAVFSALKVTRGAQWVSPFLTQPSPVSVWTVRKIAPRPRPFDSLHAYLAWRGLPDARVRLERVDGRPRYTVEGLPDDVAIPGEYLRVPLVRSPG